MDEVTGHEFCHGPLKSFASIGESDLDIMSYLVGIDLAE